MQISFATQKLQKICNNDKKMRGEFGVIGSERLRRRLDELLAAECLEDLRNLPQTRCHELTEDLYCSRPRMTHSSNVKLHGRRRINVRRHQFHHASKCLKCVIESHAESKRFRVPSKAARDMPHQNQNQHNHKRQPQPAAWPISPVARMVPIRKSTHHEHNQNDQK